MGNAAKKNPRDEVELEPNDEEEEEEEGEGGDDDESDEDDGDDDEDEDDEEVDDETAVLSEVCGALRDGLESGVSIMVVGKKIFLDLDDDTRWELRLKRRD